VERLDLRSAKAGIIGAVLLGYFFAARLETVMTSVVMASQKLHASQPTTYNMRSFSCKVPKIFVRF
jgi:hypothetical protein